MSTKPVTTRTTTASCAGYVQRGLGRETPGAGRGSGNAAGDDARPSILQLNTAGGTANKINVIEQLAYKNKTFIIVLQETHCTTADKLVTPNFSPAGSVLSTEDDLVRFVHERLEWSLDDQSPEQSETEWLCVDVTGYKIIDVYKSPRSRFTPMAIPTFTHPSLHVGDSTANTGVTKKHPLTVRACTPGQHPTTLDCCMAQRKQPFSPLTNGTSAPTQTWPSRVSARTTDCLTDVF